MPSVIVEENFNPRTPVGCDGLISAIGGALASFQSTHPSGVRRGSPVQVGRAAYFNPRTPVGCDTLTMTASPAWWYFNPRTPVGCDDDKTLQRAFTSEFQSTHPSGVRPYVADIREMPRFISIHAPQWGATCRTADRMSTQHVISIHAPQWGATSTRHSRNPSTCYFNPRTPVGCDLHHAQTFRRHDAISIHAPQWGATSLAWLPTAAYVFQSTHPSGVRLAMYGGGATTPEFQSTHPSGVRRIRK